MLDQYIARKYRSDTRPPVKANLIRDKAAIVGIGETTFSRNSGRDELDMACEAITKAVDDAGLKMDDIDGLEAFTLDRNSMAAIVMSLGIPNLRFTSEVSYGGGAAAALGMHAAAAAVTGVANYVVCYRSLNEASGFRYGRGDGYAEYMLTAVSPNYGYHWPFGFVTPLAWNGVCGQRWMHDFGITREQIGWWPVVVREHAQQNPKAIFHGKPLTHEDYMNSPVIVNPMKLHDCCVDTDGACAYIVTTAERARDLKQRPAYILAAAQGCPGEQEIETSYNRSIISGLPEIWYLGQELYRIAGVNPEDIDVAQLYDASSFKGIIQLEELGFCERGEGGAFIEGGHNIRVGGKIPVNTSGGLLSEAYVHGVNLLIEGVRQIRGESPNQVDGVELCMVTSSPGVPTAGLILRR
ncbi:lipid-transfer protein [Chloroflexota bacterium]